MKKRVLFVDDNQKYLDTYRMVFCRTDEWSCYYASDVLAAIDYLNYVEVDIIVVDLTLPLFDGSQILEYVKSRFPSIIRIIFTDCKDINAHLKVVKLAHQFYSKTMEIGKIEQVIQEIYSLHRIIISDKARRILSQVDTIPSLPDIFFELRKHLMDHDCSIRDVGKMIATDVGLTATILKIVNSAYFGVSQKISTPEQAASLLGLELIEALVVTAHLFSSFKVDPSLPISGIMKHSFQCTQFAKAIAEHQKAPKQTVDAVAIAAMLHDVGRLVFACSFPEKYKNVLNMCDATQRASSEVERDIIGIDHAQAGAYLLGLWGFSHPVVEAVAYHHAPSSYIGNHPGLVGVLHSADILTYELRPADTHEGVEVLDRNFLTKHNLSTSFENWRKVCNALIGRVELELDM